MFEPLWPPCEPARPLDEEEEDCEPPPLGIEALDPPLRPEDEGEGMLGELRPPELPDEPLDGEEGDDGDEGMDDEDCCCCGQPPIRNAQTAPIAVA